MVYRVLLVDDSKVARMALRGIVEHEASELAVVGLAANADEARRLADELAPDLVMMDVELGGADGIRLCEELLSRVRTRIVIVTGVAPRDPALMFRALAAGALDVLAKPSGAPEGASERARFVRALRALASVPLLKGLRPLPAPQLVHESRREAPSRAPRPPQARAKEAYSRGYTRVLIGVSTGGPPLLERIFRLVRPDLPIPVVIVQHIAAGFGAGFARWLGQTTGHEVRYCHASTSLEAGVVYVANDASHLHLVAPTFARVGPSPRARVATPSVDELFESAALHDASRTLAILLTGMGGDGAIGLGALREAGATTVAQDPMSCVVSSMPSTAIALDAAIRVLDPEEIAALLDGLHLPPADETPTLPRGCLKRASDESVAPSDRSVAPGRA